MMPTRQGSIHMFRFLGIDVYLHWSWLVVAVFEIQMRQGNYSLWIWNVLEYVSVFFIVLLHEYGHSLACRQVGGQANQIVLWPLGGVAYVAPPPRPGATLWSIAAGPLVNVALFPALTVLAVWTRMQDLADSFPNLCQFVQGMWLFNFVMLCFNLLPIYPLDGGQIVRSLLWFFLGRARSLMVAAIIGFIGVAAMIAGAVFMKSVWFGVLAVFILLNCWRGLLEARLLAKVAELPRRAGFACPVCHQGPPIGAFWICHKCGRRFDTFETQAVCPGCGEAFAVTRCLDCGQARPIGQWRGIEGSSNQ
jgi:Zn-dependent protease